MLEEKGERIIGQDETKRRDNECTKKWGRNTNIRRRIGKKYGDTGTKVTELKGKEAGL